MKHFFTRATSHPIRPIHLTLLTLLILPYLILSCSDFSRSEGASLSELRWHFDPGQSPLTRAETELPDTNDFLLSVKDASGEILYSGAYGDSPEKLLVRPGSYQIEVKSSDFSAPAFDRPQYGDTEIVVLKAGESADVKLCCTMINCGLHLEIGASFRSAFPSAVLLLGCQEGRLLYSQYENRTAYFLPGTVSLTMSSGGSDEVLFSRLLSPREILNIGLSASAPTEEKDWRMTVTVDTTKNRKYENITVGEGSSGEGNPGADIENALNVTQARAAAGTDGIWVFGYIVGGDLTSAGTKMNTAAPFSSATHLAIAARSSVTEKASCLSVELPKGTVREGLNLADNPDLLGRRVYLHGNIVSSYYGIPGLKSPDSFVLK